ncbi:YceI family protein [Ekhidna sp.]|uniref:YceI family protein n=1 Tax=Ekhidna sp. TaxID=2608089 RepID=UPI003B50EDBF
MKNLIQKLIPVIAIVLTAHLSVGQSQKYIVDAGHTSVQTEVMRFGVVPVVGRFTQLSGSIAFDSANVEETKASLTIQTNSYSANNIDGDAAIKSPVFLDVSNYPEIKFELNSLEKSADGHMAKGTLELHGTKKEIEVPVTIYGPDVDLPTRKQSIGITGSLVINRTDYGVGKTMQLPNGRDIVSNDVKISFAILGIAE